MAGRHRSVTPGWDGLPWSPRRLVPHLTTGHDGHRRTNIPWREVDLVDGKVARRLVVMLDATMSTATGLTFPRVVEMGQAILAATQ